ncbi:MAG: SGNH/GDSL hydrolase family protein [Clostridia bacterium]|nr:SGNH/GDSL hydrolase family protein [Clostridia bacterium]
MKRISAILLILALTLLTACGADRPGDITESASAPTAAPQTGTTEQTTAEPTTEAKPAREVDRSAEEIYKNHPELTPVNYDSPALLPKSDDMGRTYIDRLTFICDSPTYWLKLYGLLSEGYNTKQIWTGPEGTMTLAYLRDYLIVDPYDGELRTIPETAALREPPMIVIAVGINGISFMDEEYFTAEYEHLIDVLQEASPTSQILLQSIYPISPSFHKWGSITNASITKGNSWILKIAEKYGLPYIDAFSALVGEDGNIRPELVKDDGLHPNADGLVAVLEYLRTHAYVPD